MYKVYEIKKRIFDDNDQEAEKVRKELKENQTFLLNLMSSPGGGKTTTLKRTIEALKKRCVSVLWRQISTALWMRIPSVRPEQKSSSYIPAACVIWMRI